MPCILLARRASSWDRVGRWLVGNRRPGGGMFSPRGGPRRPIGGGPPRGGPWRGGPIGPSWGGGDGFLSSSVRESCQDTRISTCYESRASKRIFLLVRQDACRRQLRTKISSAVGDAGFLLSTAVAVAILSNALAGWVDLLFPASRNGFRETGLGGGSSKGEVGV